MNARIAILGALAVWGGPSGWAADVPSPVPPSQVNKESRAGYESRIRAELRRIKAGIGGAKRETVLVLRKKAKAAERELSRLEKAREKNWAELRVRVERAMEDLRKAYHDLSESPGA